MTALRRTTKRKSQRPRRSRPSTKKVRQRKQGASKGGDYYAQVLRRASNPEVMQRRIAILMESLQSLIDSKRHITNPYTLKAVDAQIEQIQGQIEAVQAMRY